MILFSDFYVYDVDTDTIVNLTIDMKYPLPGPSPCFSQRAVIDIEHDSICFFSSSSPYSSSFSRIDNKTYKDEGSEKTTVPLSEAHKKLTDETHEIWTLSLDFKALEDDFANMKDFSHCSTGKILPKPYSNWKPVQSLINLATTSSNETTLNDSLSNGSDAWQEPSLRFAHQFVYDPVDNVIYYTYLLILILLF